MADGTDLFDIIATTRAMRRLKPNPVPDDWCARSSKPGSARLAAATGSTGASWSSKIGHQREGATLLSARPRRGGGAALPQQRPPSGVSREQYDRQHAAVSYLTEHFHEAPIWIVACLNDGNTSSRSSGASIYPAVQNMLLAARALGLGGHPDHQTFTIRERGGGRPGTAAGRAFLRHHPHRLPDGPLRPGAPRAAIGHRLPGSLGEILSGACVGPAVVIGAGVACSRRTSSDFGIFMEFENRQGAPQAESFRDSFALVEAADAWGLDGVWLAEMHFNPARSVLSAPIVVATSIATRTKRACGWAWPCRCCP